MVTVKFHFVPIPFFLVDGQFASWSDWSECSKTCGSNSYRSRERTCTNPPPRYGGEDCEGRTVERHRCSKPPCLLTLDAYKATKVFLQPVNSRHGMITFVLNIIKLRNSSMQTWKEKQTLTLNCSAILEVAILPCLLE